MVLKQYRWSAEGRVDNSVSVNSNGRKTVTSTTFIPSTSNCDKNECVLMLPEVHVVFLSFSDVQSTALPCAACEAVGAALEGTVWRWFTATHSPYTSFAYEV